MKDRTSRTFELIAAVLLGIYSSVMIVYARINPATTASDGMESYTFPVILYGIMLVCCIILIIQNRILASKKRKEYQSLLQEQKDRLDEEKKKEFIFEKLDARVWATIGAIIIYAAMWQVIGFMLSTFLFIICEAKILKKEEPAWRCVLVALAAVFIIYIVFVRVFSISLPETFLGALM